MPGMGQLTGGQRYVVMIQIPGPKTLDDAKKVNDLVAKLRELGAEMKISITGVGEERPRPS